MERLFERAFNKVHGDVQRVLGDQPADQQDKAEDETAEDAIQRILRCWKSKEYFKLLQLPDPEADELGRPQWPCTSGDVSRAFRKLSVLVHPDKNPGGDARAAFEALNETHRLLKDSASLEQVLRDVAERVRNDKERQESRIDTMEGRAALAATKNAAMKRLRKEEGAAFEETIRAQMRARQEEAARKAAAAARSRAVQLQEEEERQKKTTMKFGDDVDEHEVGSHRQTQTKKHARHDDGRQDDNDSDDAGAARRAAAAAAAARRRKKPNIMH